ncbi:hypothetical protein QYE76_019942 [Lolium multiflorum]|uniref:Uncharacterized protein n=1 Tax=Lolium multiflorum TaxID=4521 RepID=A0AAD8R5E0_LOLMU|nr:hypothetical protein QYE76_019942 [Lolium multiflorum]
MTRKAESSHSRGKEKEEAVPRDRPQDNDKRYLAEEEVRNIRHPRPLSEHLLSKYEQPYDRRRRYDNDDEGYRRSDANRRYRQNSGHNDGYERHARGGSREPDNVDRHWDCPFFRHCWDSGMSRLPTIGNCPNWDGDEVEVVHADDSAEISTAGMGIWETSGQEPLSGINLDDCERIDVTKNGVRLVLSTGLTV